MLLKRGVGDEGAGDQSLTLDGNKVERVLPFFRGSRVLEEEK